MSKSFCIFAPPMDTNSLTSGPVRPLSSQELGIEHLTDYELLSDSGHNLVYRAQMGGKWVVLKAAKPNEGEQTRNQLLLEREFEIMHRLDSIYVVQTIAMVDDPQLGRSILMEYVHGRPLDRFIAENPSSAERRRVADELMEALIFLHERQVVHGDLKPGNILITDSDNHVRLIDFGFSDNEAYIAKNIGSTPSVSSPEQLPTDVLKPERDIYALGKMLELLFPHSIIPSIHHFINCSPIHLRPSGPLCAPSLLADAMVGAFDSCNNYYCSICHSLPTKPDRNGANTGNTDRHGGRCYAACTAGGGFRVAKTTGQDR